MSEENAETPTPLINDLDRYIAKEFFSDAHDFPYSKNFYACQRIVDRLRASGWNITLKSIEGYRWVAFLDKDEPIEDIPGIIDDSYYLNSDLTGLSIEEAICKTVVYYIKEGLFNEHWK